MLGLEVSAVELKRNLKHRLIPLCTSAPRDFFVSLSTDYVNTHPENLFG